MLVERRGLILVVAVIIGVAVALLRGGAFRHLASVQLRLGWLALLCLLVQAYVIYSPADRVEVERPFHAVLMVGSYAALGVVAWINRRITGMPILGLGLLLNLLVMAANGGFMPVSQEAILTTGTRAPQELPAEGMRLPRSKDVLLASEHTRLWILSDVITAPKMPLARVYSLGDLIVAVGAFVLLQAAMVPSKRKEIFEEGMSPA